MTIWLNGTLLAAETARINPSDRGFLLGDGVFETMAAHKGKLVFADLHFDRLMRGADTLGINLPYSIAELTSAATALLTETGNSNQDRTAVRLTLTRGTGPRGLVPSPDAKPTVLITCSQSPALKKSVSAIIATGRRNEFSQTANLKTLAYLDQVLARQEADTAGTDDAILLNTQGKVTCATAANLFLWDSNTLITPPLSDGCLNGTVRRKVLDIALQTGLAAFEESITPSTLANVESAFLTNSLVGLQPVREISGRPLKIHTLQNKLRTAFDQAERQSIQA
ncbi:aminotransferase class IV [Parvibaculaceae bacterium PLY_AMNH_Bact1]|nr:aminotransferase class IV [Parvibaculaceae bacterium PLY_AMNH_Bact1]